MHSVHSHAHCAYQCLRRFRVVSSGLLSSSETFFFFELRSGRRVVGSDSFCGDSFALRGVDLVVLVAIVDWGVVFAALSGIALAAFETGAFGGFIRVIFGAFRGVSSSSFSSSSKALETFEDFFGALIGVGRRSRMGNLKRSLL